jgi:hypothetical protein
MRIAKAHVGLWWGHTGKGVPQTFWADRSVLSQDLGVVSVVQIHQPCPGYLCKYVCDWLGHANVFYLTAFTRCYLKFSSWTSKSHFISHLSWEAQGIMEIVEAETGHMATVLHEYKTAMSQWRDRPSLLCQPCAQSSFHVLDLGELQSTVCTEILS